MEWIIAFMRKVGPHLRNNFDTIVDDFSWGYFKIWKEGIHFVPECPPPWETFAWKLAFLWSIKFDRLKYIDLIIIVNLHTSDLTYTDDIVGRMKDLIETAAVGMRANVLKAEVMPSSIPD